MRTFFLLSMFVVVFGGGVTRAQAQAQGQPPVNDAAFCPVIPYPTTVGNGNGHFLITAKTTIAVEGEQGVFSHEKVYLQEMMRRYLGPTALQPSVTGGANTILLQQDSRIQNPEGYDLRISNHAIVLSAGSGAGMFYAIQTLRQLLPAAVENGHGKTLSLPLTTIHDEPAFAWRGMMLDVSRHFFSVSYVKHYIDMMAFYKLNKLHLHLTDDQGWRIEIKKYPRLTSEGGWRTFNDQDSSCMKMEAATGNPDMRIDPTHIRQHNGKTQYGGFYTQEEIKEVIRYAGLRHIEVIPEVDMPGHMMAAIALYPELTCDGKKGEDWTKGFSTPICPCKESTLEFAKDVFTEIAALFPSRYIHIGGDEVERRFWAASPVCQSFMKEHHIESLEKLQSYFNDYMQAFFQQKGKTLMGWDEIVEGGIDSAAMVMFWRPWARQSPYKATANGNKVVMTPDGPFYFDAIPDKNSLSAAYHYDPLDKMYGMNAEQEKNIIGVQANLWTERVPSDARADYLVMPRMSALAEVGWTHRNHYDDRYENYLERLSGQYDRLDRLHIRYRLPDLPDMADRCVFVDTAEFMVKAPMTDLTVHYTTNGTFPSLTSPVLSHPLHISQSMMLKLAEFTPSGRRGDVYTVTFDKQSYAAPVPGNGSGSNGAALQPGLQATVYMGSFNNTAGIKGAVAQSLVLDNVGLPAGEPTTGYGMHLTGYIDVPETGIYSFFLTSDDGSVLHIANRQVVDNDGLHAPEEKGGQVALQKGRHAFQLDYIDGGGGSALGLTWSLNGSKAQAVPASWFSH